jgi:predicted Zn-ribbon and HTH transcriptional regulator/predicted nucleic acid-binding Zn ribbon protein
MIEPEARRCLNCGNPLTRSYQTKFCGHKCRAAVAGAARRIDNTRPCKVCGTLVDRRPRKGSDSVVCSDTCLRESRRRVALANVEAGKGPPRTEMTDEQRTALSRRMKGGGAPWWKGGRNATDSGYVMVLAPDDYPFPESLGATRRIREHRMVMEMHIGRALRPEEVVHHINGVRTDNRIENLELLPSHSEHMREHADASAERMRRNSDATRSVPATCRTCGAEYRTNARSTGECTPCRTKGYEAKRRGQRRAP